MWTSIGPGHGRQLTAAADDERTGRWCLELRAGGDELAVMLTAADMPLGLTVRLEVSEGARWPVVSESYTRGEDFVVSMPQSAASEFGVTLQARLLECGPRRAVAELLIAVQTDLLDCHPRLQLRTAPAAPVASSTASLAEDGAGPGKAARLRLTPSAAGHAALLFGGDDGPVEVDGLNEQESCFQLFGEFLEKGVIRKARPWLGLWRGAPPDDQELMDLLEQRRCSPLPLTT